MAGGAVTEQVLPTQVPGRRFRLASPATATVLAALVLMLAAAIFPLSVIAHQSVLSNASPVVIFLPIAAVGLVVARRLPRNPIGWLLLACGDGIARKERVVAVFVIERSFAEAIDLSEADVREINLINDEADVRWLYSFLSVDRRKTYCLYEASSAEAVRQAAVRAGLPADVVIEVCGKLHSDGSLNPV